MAESNNIRLETMVAGSMNARQFLFHARTENGERVGEVNLTKVLNLLKKELGIKASRTFFTASELAQIGHEYGLRVYKSDSARPIQRGWRGYSQFSGDYSANLPGKYSP